ncbi:MAG: hypothetical protein DDT20_00858 [Firmicutes bacterium]|nr:hypothetical protein [Bacillota bacterium]
MTLPDERRLAVQRTGEFLLALMDPKKTPRVPRAVRLAALACLRHYPSSFELRETSEACPRLWGEA